MRSKKKIDLGPSIRELETLLRRDPSCIESEIVRKGDNVLSIFSDPNFRSGFQDLATLREKLILDAIEDLAGGATMLSAHTLGLTFAQGELKPFASPHGETPKGNIVFSIGLKSSVAFRAWSKGVNIDEKAAVSEEDGSAAIYLLIVLLASLPHGSARPG